MGAQQGGNRKAEAAMGAGSSAMADRQMGSRRSGDKEDREFERMGERCARGEIRMRPKGVDVAQRACTQWRAGFLLVHCSPAVGVVSLANRKYCSPVVVSDVGFAGAHRYHWRAGVCVKVQVLVWGVHGRGTGAA